MLEKKTPRSYDSFVGTVNEIIIKGNESVALIKQGRQYSPYIPNNADTILKKSKDLSFMQSDMRKDYDAGKLSKEDYTKRIDILKTLIDEGYYNDPVGSSTNTILNEWNALHNIQPKQDQVKKSKEVEALEKQVKILQNTITDIIARKKGK